MRGVPQAVWLKCSIPSACAIHTYVRSKVCCPFITVLTFPHMPNRVASSIGFAILAVGVTLFYPLRFSLANDETKPGSNAISQDVPQVPRDRWKDCTYNDQTIGCIDKQLFDGLQIIWKDGLRMTYREQAPTSRGGLVFLKDTLGGLWQREILVQGNTLLTNLYNGNRIFIPLRLTCKPPYKGEVGYCYR